MRVREGIRLVRGEQRFSVYSLHDGLCKPATLDEAYLLKMLSQGKQATPRSTGLASTDLWALLSNMRKKGWLDKGSPQRVELENIGTRASRYDKPGRLARAWIETTLTCNLYCKHCYAGAGPEVDRREELSLPEWEGVLRDILDYGVDNLTFIGGEPTIRHDVLALGVELVKRHSPTTSTGIFSNLYQFGRSESDIAFIKENGLHIATSLYGMCADDHDAITGRTGSWHKTLGALQLLIKHKVPLFVGYFRASRDESNEAVEAWLKALGITQFDIQNHANVGRALQLLPVPSKKRNRLPGALHFSPGDIEKNASVHNCFYDHIAITPGGEVLGCIMMREPVLGRLTQQSLDEVLAGDKFHSLARLTKNTVDGCAVCEYRYACFDCRPAAVSNGTNLRAKPDCGYDPRLPLDEARHVLR